MPIFPLACRNQRGSDCQRAVRLRAAASACAVAWVLLQLPLTAWARAPYTGQSLYVALRDLSAAAGVQLVYSTQLVPPTARVEREPLAATPLEAIGQLLAPRGLALQPVDAHTYAVVRASGPAPAPAAPQSVPPAPASEEPLSAVIVTASRYSLATDLVDVRNVLTHGAIDAMPRLAEDALRSVQHLPGAASTGVAGLAHIRGGATNETQVLFDGLPLYEPFHLRLLQGPSSLLDERIVEGLDYYAGGFTAEFGDRMSAIVDVRSRRPDADEYYELGLSLFHANALASHRFADGKGQWLVSARRSNLDEVADVIDSEFGEPSYADGFARIDYAWSPATRGSLHALLARDSVTVTRAEVGEEADAEYSNTYLWATLAHDWSARASTTALVSFTDVAAERNATVDEPGLRKGAAVDERDYDVLGLKVDSAWQSERWLQRAGFDIRHLDASYDYTGQVVFAPDYPFPGADSFARQLAPSPAGEHYALYYTVRARLTDDLTAEAGLRWDEQTYGGDSDDQLGPRLNVAWRLDERTRLRASWGRYQQSQGIEELAVEDGRDTFERAQYVDQLIVGIERDVAAAASVRVEAYRKDYARLATRYETLYDPLSLAPELRWDRVALQPDSALADGLELLYTLRELGPWNGWLGYSWSRVRDDFGGARIRRSWDQTHALDTGVGWTRGPWQAAVTLQYHTGWPVTPIGLDTAGNVQLGTLNADRYASFASLDARVRREWALRHGTLAVQAEVTNALDRRNPCCTEIEYDDSDPANPQLQRDALHWLPLLPSIGVRWTF
jgi:hypothetical protein